MSSNIGLGVGVSALFSAYSLSLFVIGAWGNAILPSSCVKQSIRSSMRTAMIGAVIMAVAYIAYGFCFATCYKPIQDEFKVPSSLLIFNIITSFVVASALLTASKDVNGESTCETSSFSTWKKAATMMATIAILFAVFCIIIISVRIYRASKKSEQDKNKEIEIHKKNEADEKKAAEKK